MKNNNQTMIFPKIIASGNKKRKRDLRYTFLKRIICGPYKQLKKQKTNNAVVPMAVDTEACPSDKIFTNITLCSDVLKIIGRYAGIKANRDLNLMNYLRDNRNLIDKEAYEQVFGKGCLDGQKIPELPENIIEILSKAEKDFRQEVMLVLIPQKVNSKPLTMVYWGTLMKENPKFFNRAKYYNDSFKNRVYATQAPSKTYWVIITKKVFNGSVNKIFSEQEALAKRNSARLPSAIEITTAIFMHYALTKGKEERLPENLYTRTTSTSYTGTHVLIGSFGARGLNVWDHWDVNQNRYLGASLLRELRVAN